MKEQRSLSRLEVPEICIGRCSHPCASVKLAVCGLFVCFPEPVSVKLGSMK